MNSNLTDSPETLNAGQNRWFFVLCDLEIWWMTLKNNRAALLCYIGLNALFPSHWCIQTKVSQETVNSGQNQQFFVLCDLEIWCMTLKNERAPFLCCFKLCASFQIHRWIQTGVTIRKHPMWVKIDDFLSSVTLKFDRWPWKTIGHLS